MTSLDPSHFPSRRDDRGQAVYEEALSSPNHKRRTTVPLPDLRFEQSYLRSIQTFIHHRSSQASAPSSLPSFVPNSSSEKKQEAAESTSLVDAGHQSGNETIDNLYGAPIDIRWQGVMWITIRDQILSPLAQGLVFGLLGIYVFPTTDLLLQRTRARFLQLFRLPLRLSDRTVKGSKGRNFARSFEQGVETNIALSK